MSQATACTRTGGAIGFVGVAHGVAWSGKRLFFAQTRPLGRARTVRKYLPHLTELVLQRKINPGKVFNLAWPLDQVAQAYRAMDDRRAIKALLRV